MSFNVEIKGLDELDAAFDNLINGVDDSLGETLKKASNPMFDKIQADAKKVDEKVKISNVKNSESNAEIVLTLDSKTWRYKEYGTSKMSATPFIRNNLDKGNEKVIDAFSKQMNKKIEESIKWTTKPK